LSNFIILFGIGGLLATPDIPMVMFWAMGLFLAHKFIFDNRKWTWLLLGIVMGCGLLSKYLFGLFIISFFAFLLYSKEHRQLLISWRFFAALLVALIVFLPNIIWNSYHQWVSIMYQMGHGLGGKTFTRFDFLGEFIGGQIGMLSIFPFILLMISMVNELRFHSKNPRRLFILAFFMVPLAFFTFSSLQKRVEPNWPCGAYVSGLLLIALLWEQSLELQKTFMRRFILFSTSIACVATIIVLIHLQTPILPLPPGKDPTAQIRGWKNWAASIDSVRAKVDPNHAMPLCTKFYQDAAFLAFYLPDHPHARALSVNSRPTHYSLFEASAGIYGKDVLIVLPGRDSLLPPEFSRRVDNGIRRATVTQSPSPRVHNPFGVFSAVLKPTP
jgi:MFS family permease